MVCIPAFYDYTNMSLNVKLQCLDTVVQSHHCDNILLIVCKSALVISCNVMHYITKFSIVFIFPVEIEVHVYKGSLSKSLIIILRYTVISFRIITEMLLLIS